MCCEGKRITLSGVPRRPKAPQGPSRTKLTEGLDGQKCRTNNCGRPATQWASLAYWCDEHTPDETLAVNCGHIDVMVLHDKVVCSWCGGLVKHNP